MFNFIRLFLITLLLSVFIEASSYSNYTKKYNEARNNYANIIGYNNKVKEIKYLKQMVYYGTKLKKSVYKYKKELNRLDKSLKLTTTVTKSYKKSKYSIKSVYQDDNKIIITFNKKIYKKDIHYFTKKAKGSYQYIFDINGRFKDAKPTKLSVNYIDRIKVVQYRFNTLRISIKNKTSLKPVYIIGNKKIIINIKPKSKQNVFSKSKSIPTLKYNSIKQKTIVIDAGHGGKDAGAVGPSKRYEKTVTLKIANNLYKVLKLKGYNVFITRNRDKYVSLRYRTKLANKKNAHMFISIHANAAPKNKKYKAKGIETYFLSPARSARAKRVAALENKGDMGSMGWSSQSTFLTVLNQGKITASNKMAIDIQKNMLYSLRKQYGKKTIKDGGVREGPFWVLVGAQMPSILIEVGYISHPKESKRIYTSKYQKLISTAIANGIDSYFLKNQ